MRRIVAPKISVIPDEEESQQKYYFFVHYVIEGGIVGREVVESTEPYFNTCKFEDTLRKREGRNCAVVSYKEITEIEYLLAIVPYEVQKAIDRIVKNYEERIKLLRKAKDFILEEPESWGKERSNLIARIIERLNMDKE
jgi:hypothetical protein